MTTTKKTYEKDMTSGSLFKSMLYFAIPLMATGVLQLLYNATDLIVVGRFAGPEALSAVGSTGAVTNLIINLFIGMSLGAGISISRYYGAKNYESIQKTVHTGITIAAIGGVFLAILAFFIVRPLLTLMQTPTDVIDMAVLYMRIFFVGMPFNLIYNYGSSMMRAVGDTKRPLRFLAISGLVNVILNLIMVIVFDMSVAGVAIATVTAQVISACFVLNCLMKKSNILKLEIKKLRIHKAQLKQIMRIGIPAGIQSSLFSISNVVVQSSVNSFNNAMITAGNAASANLEGFMFVATNSVTQGAMTAAGQNMGAKKYDRVKKNIFISIALALLVSFTIGLILRTFAEEAIMLYNNTDAEVISVGVLRLTFMTTAYVTCALMDVMTGQLKGMGYYILPTVISFCGVCLFRIAWVALVFTKYPTVGTIYWLYPISWLLSAFFLAILLVVAVKRLPKANKEEASSEA